jgi:hypothetical protein
MTCLVATAIAVDPALTGIVMATLDRLGYANLNGDVLSEAALSDGANYGDEICGNADHGGEPIRILWDDDRGCLDVAA